MDVKNSKTNNKNRRSLAIPIPTKVGLPSCDIQTKELSPLGCKVEFEHDGSMRSFLLQMPLAAEKSNGKVIFVFHQAHAKAETILHLLHDYWIEGYTLVVPNGLDVTWNADICCGESLKNKVDDIGFVAKIHKHLVENKQDLFNFDTNLEEVMLIGTSNGGFLVSKIGLLASRCHPDFKWVRGFVSIAGNQYDGALYDIRTVHGCRKPVHFLTLHGKNDQAVLEQGCCAELTPECSAGISKVSKSCTDLDTIFAWWETINDCKGGGKNSSAVVKISIAEGKCKVGSDCRALTKYCSFPHIGHNIQAQIPKNHVIISDFFKEVDQFTLNAVTKQGLDDASAKTWNHAFFFTLFVIFFCMVTCLGCVRCYQRRRSNQAAFVLMAPGGGVTETKKKTKKNTIITHNDDDDEEENNQLNIQ